MNTDIFIDVTVLHPSIKHPTIFEAFDSIAEGNAVVIQNDHDPKPLYYKLLGEKGNGFSWTYLSNGPEIWEVEIRKSAPRAETVGEIASRDMKKAMVLKQFGIDFCCGGKKTLEQACAAKDLDISKVREELEAASRQNQGIDLDFNSFSLSFLADYIVNVHHSYVNKNLPLLEEMSRKVAERHGNTMPFLIGVYKNVQLLCAELRFHMKKEEQILFPAVKSLEDGGELKIGFETIGDPIHAMESDHDLAGELMKKIRTLTNDYEVPENACNSFRMLYHILQAFENDLFQHIHLENNILFPKAITLEKLIQSA